MNRVKRGFVARKKRKNVISFTKGFVGAHSKLFRIAHQQMMKSLNYAYSDRKKKKNQNKKLWITRINAAVRTRDRIRDMNTEYTEYHKFPNYSQIINSLKKATILVNKKLLCEIQKYKIVNFNTIINITEFLSPSIDSSPILYLSSALFDFTPRPRYCPPPPEPQPTEEELELARRIAQEERKARQIEDWVIRALSRPKLKLKRRYLMKKERERLMALEAPSLEKEILEREERDSSLRITVNLFLEKVNSQKPEEPQEFEEPEEPQEFEKLEEFNYSEDLEFFKKL
jgi:large subunit ribosomal protein L20